MIWISVILLAVAVSFDSLAMGITYGMNRITIPLWSKVVLSSISGLSLSVSMALGALLEQRISTGTATMIGGGFFVCLGLYHLWRNYRSTDSRILLRWRIPIFGLIIQICQEPLLADRDHSQIISAREAVVLGGALALDSIAAGFGGAILALPIWPTAIAVMLGNFFFMAQGIKTGIALATSSVFKRDLRWLPGAIVLGIGVLKIIAG